MFNLELSIGVARGYTNYTIQVRVLHEGSISVRKLGEAIVGDINCNIENKTVNLESISELYNFMGVMEKEYNKCQGLHMTFKITS